jgi:PAS domain S-box-containing protein
MTPVGGPEGRVTVEQGSDVPSSVADRRFEALVAAAPDAIVVVGADGRILAVNPQAEALFRGAAEDLVGRSVDDLLPGHLRDRHAALRGGYVADPRTRPMGAGLDLEARRLDGTLVPVDIGLTPIHGDEGPAIAAFVRDATERRQAELVRRRYDEAELRRRQALELNDTVVQGLVSLRWQLDEADDEAARRTADATLAAARRIMADLLTDDHRDGSDGNLLVRSEHASSSTPPALDPAPRPGGARRGPGRRVLVADDAADLRFLLRHRLSRTAELEVIAEAADGQTAVDLALEHRPDVVLLDLSMPVLDGLEAAARIRAALPDVYIIVLSGYPEEVMGQRAIVAGADRYCEKTATLDEVYEAVAGEPAEAG